MKKIKTFNRQEREYYVPTCVEVMEIATQEVLCQSGANEDYSDNVTPVDWFN